MAKLDVEALRRTFPPDVVAVAGVTFEVADGEIATLLGPSGCGKSTVLRLIAGLDRPDRGEVRVDGRSVLDDPPERRGVGLMFQELALFPHMDMRTNIAFGLRMARWPRESRERRVDELLELLGLEAFGHRRIEELSGGERQRVALARALAPQPRVLLLDEPLGALDESLKRSLRHELRSVLREVGTTALLVSHDLRDAVALADRLVVMEAGRVLQTGTVADVLRAPSDASVASMVGYVTLLDGRIEGDRVAEPGVGAIPLRELGGSSTASAAPGSGRVRVMGHPSALLAVPAGQGVGLDVSGVVRAARPDGPSAIVEVELGSRRLDVRWEWDPEPPGPGRAVELAARPGTLRCFPIEPPVASDGESEAATP